MIRFFQGILMFLALLVGMAEANPTKLENSTVELISEVKRIQPGKPFWVALKVTMKPGAHTYWANPGDSGFAMSIEWSLPDGFSASPIHWIPPQRLELGHQANFGYTGEAFYLVEITPSQEISAQMQTLTADASWLVCDELCIPESAKISLTLPVAPESNHPDYSDHQALVHRLKDELPTKLVMIGAFSVIDGLIHFRIPLNDQDTKGINSASLFPVKNGLINNGATQDFSFDKGILTITVPKGKAAQAIDCEALIQINDKINYKVHNYLAVFKPKASLDHYHPTTNLSLLMILGFAFLGGVILNTMPCVFPILSIKALTISKKKQSQFHQIRLQGAIYSAGVIVSFLGLAFILITLKQSGHSIGWGFQMQSPYFISFMIYLTFLIGLSLSGLFYLPIFFGNTSASLEENKLSDSFLLGILAVLIATPCTAPFMGIAIGYALTQSMLTTIIVFCALGFGFAAPYFLLCLFPILLKILPKPGAWMETFKEFLAFPMYATALWLLWILVQQDGSRALITVGMGLVIMAFCLWLWGKLKIQHRIIKIIVFTLFAALSLFPIAYLEGDTFKEQVVTQPFSKDLLDKYRQEKVPVFINVTASWCITCKYNELILTSDSTGVLFKQKGIRYLEADWTSQNAEITAFLEGFDRSGIPLYIFFPASKGPIILPQLLTEKILKETISNNQD